MVTIPLIIGMAAVLFLFVSADYYVLLKFYLGVKYIFPHTGIWIFIILGIFIFFFLIAGYIRSVLPFSERVKNVIGNVNSYWMGIFIYIFLYFMISDIVLLLLRLIKILKNPVPNSIYFFTDLAVILATIVTVCYGIYNAGKIKHVSYNITLEGKKLDSELNIVLISDVHLGALNSEKHLKNIIRVINDLEPDIVCMAGDIFENDFYAIHKPDEAVRLLNSIKTKYGVYACLGNHDSGKTFNNMLDFLKHCNIKALKDEYVVIANKLVLVGRLDSFPIGGYGYYRRKKLDDVIAGADNKLPVIVMDHNPANIKEYGSEVDLILAGHTHRGQIFPGNLFTGALFAADYGYYRKDSSSPHLIVTSGAGTWGMPMRIGSNSEVVSIKLTAKKVNN